MSYIWTPAAASGGWQTALDLDFSALASSGTIGDGAVAAGTIGAAGATKFNSATATNSTTAVVNGSGLVFTYTNATSPATYWNQGAITMPGFDFALASIIPSFDVTMPLRISTYISASNETANNDLTCIGVGVANHTSIEQVMTKGFNTGPYGGVGAGMDRYMAGSFIGTTGYSTTNRIFQLQMPNGVAAVNAFMLSAAGSAFPAQSTYGQNGQWGAAAATAGAYGAAVNYPASSWYLTLAAGKNVSATVYVSTIKLLRIEYKAS